MADQDDNVLVPAVAGTAVGVASGAAVSHLMNNEKSVAKGMEKAERNLSTAQAAYDAKEADVLKNLAKKDPGAHAMKEAYEKAAAAHTRLKGEHAAAVGEAFTAATKGLDITTSSKIGADGLKGELKYLEQQPESLARGLTIESTKAKIDFIEGLTLKEGEAKETFKALSPEAQKKALTEGIQQIEDKFSTLRASHSAEVAAFEAEHNSGLAAARMAAISEANPEIAGKIAQATRPLDEGLKTAAAEVEKTKAKWEPKLEELVGRKAKNLGKASEAVERLAAMEGVNAEKGFVAALKRPFSHLKNAGTGTKLAILGTGITLGAMTYNHMREKSADRGDMSFTDRLDQQRLAAAMAEQSATRGA